MEYTHKNHGTCSSATTVELDENNIIRSVAFCGTRPTSCPDQLAETLREAVAANHS